MYLRIRTTTANDCQEAFKNYLTTLTTNVIFGLVIVRQEDVYICQGPLVSHPSLVYHWVGSPRSLFFQICQNYYNVLLLFPSVLIFGCNFSFPMARVMKETSCIFFVVSHLVPSLHFTFQNLIT